MINWLSTWAEQIVVAVVIATIIEMILPNGNSKKYIKAVIGVYIMFTIISPILGKFTNIDFSKIDYDDYFKEYENTKTISSNLNSSNTKSVEDIYTENLKQDIKGKLQKQGFTVESINVEIEFKDEVQYGEINSITLTLYKDSINEGIKINKVNIGNTIEETKNKEQISESDKNYIKEYLVEVYEVNKKYIKINE